MTLRYFLYHSRNGEVGQETGEMLGTLFFVPAFPPAAIAQPVMVFRMAQQSAERHPCRFDGGLAKIMTLLTSLEGL